MKNFLFTLFFLMATTMSLCQDYGNVIARIRMIIPNNQVVTQLRIFIEERDSDTQFQMAPGFTLAQLIALGGITVSQPSGGRDTTITDVQTLGDNKYWRIGVVGFNDQGVQCSNIPVTAIIRKPLSYVQAIILLDVSWPEN